VCPLGPQALERLRAPVLETELRDGSRPLPPPTPVKTEQMPSLASFLRQHLKDPRNPRGVRHSMVSMVAIATLAIAAGCQGPHAIHEFAQSLNHHQRRRLGCRRTPGTRREYDVPCERTFSRLLEAIDSDRLRQSYTAWMASLNPKPVRVLHLDGKVLRNADPAEERLHVDRELAAAAAELDTPAELQKPKAEKALTLVNFQTPEQRLIDQIAVPRDTNEEAAVAAHLPKMDLAGVIVIADAAHTTKANCRHLTQEQGAEYLLCLKGNQPKALAKAQQLLSGNTPPAGRVDG
ncbi:MAG: transposase family protein, partial [Verrucomicrobiae bacterium]|nr:transposase family protein [Verrucomicrobiae bacterium]